VPVRRLVHALVPGLVHGVLCLLADL
jgi:hypothetical protein